MDPPRGNPPLTDESGDVRVALNGEIYNYRALQSHLEQRGHRFGSSCDTEVLAHLAESLAPVELASSLHGMFAFAVWDDRRQRLILGRDRLGKKPLYYWYDGRDIVFGSEIKAVLADPRVPRELDLAIVPAYLAFGYAPSPRTFFRGISALPPGTVLTWERGRVTVESYWNLPSFRGDEFSQASRQELAAETRRLLTQAVTDRLAADVPLGAFLSGGIDSSAIVALMATHMSQPVRTFCIGFDDAAYDERRWARLVAERFATDHTEEVVRPDASALLDDVLYACDQPFADSSALPTYLLSKLTRTHVTVALSGDGGDEVFAGYERFAAGLLLARLSSMPTVLLSSARAASSRLTSKDGRGSLGRAGRFLRLAGQPMPDAYEGLVRIFDDGWLMSAGLSAQASVHHEVWADSEGAPLAGRLLDLNRRTYLVDDLLVKADRMSMAHALEVRSPFLDTRLVEFAARVPSMEHLQGRQLKLLLKRSLAGLLPDEILSRPKRGFGVPLDGWFRNELRVEAHARLLGRGARVARLVSPEALSHLVDEHDRGKAAHGQRLWSLLMLERFLERENF
jgi:asparagine synthase (glutamine-hydrolysing)